MNIKYDAIVHFAVSMFSKALKMPQIYLSVHYHQIEAHNND